MHKKLSISLALGTIILSGFLPIVAEPARAQRSASEYCDRKAREYARRNQGSIVGDAISGSIKARIIGRILGGRKGARRGARDGAILGALGSGEKRRKRRERAYNREFRRCMNRER